MKELKMMDTLNVEAVVKGIAKDDAKKTVELMEAFFMNPLDHLNESVGFLVEQVVDDEFIKDLIDKQPVRVEMDEFVRQTSIVLFLPLNKMEEYDLVIGGLLAAAVAKYVSQNKDKLKLAQPMFELLSDAGQVKQLMTFNGVRYADRIIGIEDKSKETANNKKQPKAKKEKAAEKQKQVNPELLKAVNYESIPKKLRIVIEKGFENTKIKENILALASKAGKPLYYDAKASKDGLLVLKQVDEQANTYTLELPYTSKIEVETDKASA